MERNQAKGDQGVPFQIGIGDPGNPNQEAISGNVKPGSRRPVVNPVKKKELSRSAGLLGTGETREPARKGAIPGQPATEADTLTASLPATGITTEIVLLQEMAESPPAIRGISKAGRQADFPVNQPERRGDQRTTDLQIPPGKPFRKNPVSGKRTPEHIPQGKKEAIRNHLLIPPVTGKGQPALVHLVDTHLVNVRETGKNRPDENHLVLASRQPLTEEAVRTLAKTPKQAGRRSTIGTGYKSRLHGEEENLNQPVRQRNLK